MGEVVILYASQTGTAQDVAERIGRQARRRHLKAKVSAIDQYPLAELLEEPLLLFVVSTTGQGTEPSNMRSFWRFLLRSDLPSDLLDHLHYTVLGLGDSSYAKYNWPAKKLYKRLQGLGATPFYDKAEADDQDYLGIDTTLDTWLAGLWDTLLTIYPIPDGLEQVAEDVVPPPWLKITSKANGTNGSSNGVSNGSNGYSHGTNGQMKEDGKLQVRLKRNDRATAPDHFQDVRYLEFEADHDLNFRPGDVLELQPQNPAEEVDKFIKLMKWSEPDKMLTIESDSSDRPLPLSWPRQTTLRELLTAHLDIFSVPRRSFFEFLSYFTSDELETEKLREFASSEGQEDLWDYANRPRRTIAEVLSEFKSATIPLEYLADVFPELRPRQFSISSSPKAYPREIHLLVAIVKYKTLLSTPRTGVCTSWLSRLRPGISIPVSIEPGSFVLPPISTPIIQVGPGTGIAPFRSFVQDRQNTPGAGQVLVFFGCRSKTKDFYYPDEWTHEGVEVVVAASRDQEEKIYVQHKIKEHSQQVWAMIQEGAWIFISGAADKMPTAVRKAIAVSCEKHGQMSEKEAQAYVEQLEAEGRIQEETWS